ncbi:MAG: hypothetical protein ACFE9C_15460 [Candidatus Hodarchaeota archaeon]
MPHLPSTNLRLGGASWKNPSKCANLAPSGRNVLYWGRKYLARESSLLRELNVRPRPELCFHLLLSSSIRFRIKHLSCCFI